MNFTMLQYLLDFFVSSVSYQTAKGCLIFEDSRLNRQTEPTVIQKHVS